MKFQIYVAECESRKGFRGTEDMEQIFPFLLNQSLVNRIGIHQILNARRADELLNQVAVQCGAIYRRVRTTEEGLQFDSLGAEVVC